jgi:large subunit ribosomal protein L18e
MTVAGLERKTDPQLKRTIVELRRIGAENEAPIWRDVAARLAKPGKTWAQVNVQKVQEVAGKEPAVVCGKVLSTGTLSAPIRVAAYHFSENARRKIEAAKGDALGILDLAKENPKGTGVRIVG